LPPDKTGSVFYTEDGGRQWSLISMLPQSLYAFQIFFVDEQHGWFMTMDALWGTGDGGRSWSRKCGIDYNLYGIVRDMFFINESVGWLVTSNGSILKCGRAE
jgi:photosystem II stability/assembly factor-like uncharacterized protein